MLELYHSINSVCAQKVRVVLAEKGLEYQEHLMTLRGDQFDPEYLKLNPNAVVPTLVHEGRPVIESSVILYYLDEAFPQPPLMPRDAHERALARQYNKLIDEYVHNSCTILTFATAFRPWFAGLSGEEIEQKLADAVAYHRKLLEMMDSSLARGPWLAGATFSLADAAVIPYILRLELLRLHRMWDRLPRIDAWYERMRSRASVKNELLERMGPEDRAPFEKLETDPWPKVEKLAWEC